MLHVKVKARVKVAHTCNGIGLNWIELDWIGLDWIVQPQPKLIYRLVICLGYS